MITVTFIRHGESEDNIRCVWAGWKDAPLSELGRKQANSLGQSFASTRFDHIYTSDLLRAHTTAQFVHQHQPEPKPPLTPNPHLREQHFGIAEGYPWVYEKPEDSLLDDLYAQKIFPVLDGRDEKFPDAESLNDLAARTDIAVKECILPHVLSAAKDESVHIALASHGLCIAETVAALLRLDPEADKSKNYRGLENTAWARVEIRRREPRDNRTAQIPPPLEVTVTHFNVTGHLDLLKDTPRAHQNVDGASTEARAFFSGETVKSGN